MIIYIFIIFVKNSAINSLIKNIFIYTDIKIIYCNFFIFNTPYTIKYYPSI